MRAIARWRWAKNPPSGSRMIRQEVTYGVGSKGAFCLNGFSKAELVWSAEVCRRNIQHAEVNGAGSACMVFWSTLCSLFKDELRQRSCVIDIWTLTR
jgi:hypothetical protein